MKELTIKDLIAECTAYDFKAELEEKKPKSWLKSVSAFSDGQGGSLFFGVDNDGIVKGLEDIQKTGEKISEGINDRMDPLPDVEMIPYKIDGMDVLQLKVNVGHYTPYYYVGDGQRVVPIKRCIPTRNAGKANPTGTMDGTMGTEGVVSRSRDMRQRPPSPLSHCVHVAFNTPTSW